MSRIRILHVTYDMGIGGTEQVIRQLIGGLDNTRYENHIVCIDGELGALGADLQATGIPCHLLHRQPGLDRALIRSLRSLTHQHDIDIVHGHQYTPYVYAVLSALFSGQRVVFTEHGRFHPDSASWKRRLVNPLLGMATDAIVAISAATRDALASYEWFPRSSVQVIYNGIDAASADIAAGVSPAKPDRDVLRDRLGIAADMPVFGTISRLDSIKNQAMMIDAFAELIETHPRCRLLLVGDGPERAALESQVDRLGVTEQVIFAGYQSPPDAWLAVIDHFLLTSFSEGTSMTLLEAMAARKACVVTHVGGNPELVTDRHDGLLIDSDDRPALLGAMRALLDEPDLADRLGTAARDTYQARFRIEHMIAGYDAVYQSILPDASKAARLTT